MINQSRSRHRRTRQPNETRIVFVPVLTYCKPWVVFSVSVLRGASVMESVLGDKHSDKGSSKHADIFDIYFIMIISDNTYTSLGTSKTYTTASPRWTTQIILHFIKQQFCYSFRGLGGKKKDKSELKRKERDMVSHSLMNKKTTRAHAQGRLYLINSFWREQSSCHIKEKICHVNKQIMWIRACRGPGGTLEAGSAQVHRLTFV